MNDSEIIRVVKEILSRGNTVEIKQRKNDLIILEVSKKISHKEDR